MTDLTLTEIVTILAILRLEFPSDADLPPVVRSLRTKLRVSRDMLAERTRAHVSGVVTTERADG